MRQEKHKIPKLNTRHRFEENWRKNFEKFAVCSDDDAGIAGWSSTGLETRLRYFIHFWDKNHHDPGLWLDLGCGAGTYSRFIAERGMRVIGLDYSFPTLQKAKVRGNSSINWCAADASRLPIKPESFNGAICFGVTQALENSSAVTNELVNAVMPGGQIWIDALNGACIPHLWERCYRRLSDRPMHLRYESWRRIKAIMKANGLVNIQLYWLPILPSRWVRFQWLLETSLARWIFYYLPGIGLLFSHSFIVYGERPLPIL
jgi:ubiquinone/menaquinone biosynthesis C-methylase UbiE